MGRASSAREAADAGSPVSHTERPKKNGQSADAESRLWKYYIVYLIVQVSSDSWLTVLETSGKSLTRG